MCVIRVILRILHWGGKSPYCPSVHLYHLAFTLPTLNSQSHPMFTLRSFTLHAPWSPGIRLSLPMHALHSPFMPHAHLAYPCHSLCMPCIPPSCPTFTLHLLPYHAPCQLSPSFPYSQLACPKVKIKAIALEPLNMNFWSIFFGSASGILE